MSGKNYDPFSLITVYLGRIHRSGKSFQLKSKNDQPQPTKLRKNQQRSESPKPKPNQPHLPHQSNQTVNQNHNNTTQDPKLSPPNRRQSPKPNPTSPTGITASDVRQLWTDLKEPVSYSGNSAEILNKIKSFQ